ncbi:MAG TPA: hypothetical protein PLP64_10600 [Pseudothermotoga sp.]|nr:hypothetical protein [Pseudothermotoga sp.]HOK84654.1 hypothetical protein [Pseudothermotoga sp.]HPP71159.1 hypothetical protein [Pseudothermotoga sp.]
MSLTSFLKDEEVCNAFRRFFKIPKFNVSAELLAPPFTENYSLVGTAFDYLLRFYVKRLNRDAIESPWASEKALDLLFLAPLLQSRDALPFDTGIIRKAEETIEFAKKAYGEYLKTGVANHELFKAVLLLAQLERVYREGLEVAYKENFLDESSVDERDIEDLRNLLSIVKPEYFKAKQICILNPTFGRASRLVRGADCDLLIDDALIDIKTTKKLELKQSYFHQLVGYYVLYTIGKIDGAPSDHRVKRLGIYFSRYAYLHTFDVLYIVGSDFLDFVNWFEKKAREKYFRLSS